MPGVLSSSDEPRSAHRLVFAAADLYRRFPLLFLVLAAGVVVPYQAIVLLAAGAGPFEQGSVGASASLLLTLADLALVGPLVSALHVHAVREVREGGNPEIPSIARQGLRVLPVVAAASIISWLGILVGFLLFIVPGVILSLRWYVVAQTAAIEHQGWLPALRRSADLTHDHYWHVFFVLVLVSLIVDLPAFLVGLGFPNDSTDVVSFLVGIVVRIVAYSFSALVTALLYFDLRARQELVFASAPAART